MRMQMSLELLVYIALSGASLLFISGVLVGKLPSIYKAVSTYSAEALVNRINSIAMLDSFNANLSTFVPGGMCNSTVKNGELETPYGAFYINPNVEIDKAFCPDNAEVKLTISHIGEKIIVGRLD
ncbi:MAG: hypothetical protein ACP5RF_02595 [Candidatus Micrarchaeia archaeon]